AEDGILDSSVTGVQTCALPICSPWLGVLAAGLTGALLGALHAGICSLPRVNDVAVGISLMLFGTGLAFFLGKPLIEPTAARLPEIGRASCRERTYKSTRGSRER